MSRIYSTNVKYSTKRDCYRVNCECGKKLYTFENSKVRCNDCGKMWHLEIVAWAKDNTMTFTCDDCTSTHNHCIPN